MISTDGSSIETENYIFYNEEPLVARTVRMLAEETESFTEGTFLIPCKYFS